jgi:hypothetical protein
MIYVPDFIQIYMVLVKLESKTSDIIKSNKTVFFTGLFIIHVD